MVRSALPLLAIAAAAVADNTPPPVPENAQIGLLAFPVTCNIYGFLQQTFLTRFSATAPVYGGSGQQVYYTDVVGNIDIPSYITGLAPLVGAKQASANVTVYLNLDNASPSSLLVYQSTINNIQFSSGGDANIRIPPGNDTLPALGPATLGVADEAHRIHLGNVQVSIELQDATGKGVFGPIPVTCGAQNIDYILGSVNVQSNLIDGGAPLEPANGYVPQFPTTLNNQESGSFRFPYDCTFGALGDYTVDLEIGGTIPTYFAPGQAVTLTNGQSFLRIPTNLTNLAAKGFPSATTFYTTINSFDILYTNANPSTFDVASTPITSTSEIPQDGSQLVIAIPENGSLTIGPVTAGANGQIVGVAVGNANATVVLQDATGKSLFSLDVTCQPPAPLELIGVPITTATPAYYSLGASASAPAATAAASSTSSSGFNFFPAASTTTAASSAAAASATGSICFDDGDCLLSGGTCVKAPGQLITGNCSK